MGEIIEIEDHIVSPEKMVTLLKQVDRWQTRPSPIFPEYLEIIKTRKDKDSNITIHINPDTGHVRKFAGHSGSNPTIEKEAEIWATALQVFNVEEKVIIGTKRQLKPDPSRGWEEVKYVEMPYMGLPLSYYETIMPGSLTKEVRDNFTHNMKRMVQEYGVLHPDLNFENVLVRISNGEILLFPIDWESADKRKTGIARNLEYYLSVQEKKCTSVFAKYYPDDYRKEIQ